MRLAAGKRRHGPEIALDAGHVRYKGPYGHRAHDSHIGVELPEIPACSHSAFCGLSDACIGYMPALPG